MDEEERHQEQAAERAGRRGRPSDTNKVKRGVSWLAVAVPVIIAAIIAILFILVF